MDKHKKNDRGEELNAKTKRMYKEREQIYSKSIFLIIFIHNENLYALQNMLIK